MPPSVPLDGPQPSQLYIDVARLDAALDWFDVDNPTYDLMSVLVDFDVSPGHVEHVGMRGDATLKPYDRERAKRLLQKYLGSDINEWPEMFIGLAADNYRFIQFIPETAVARNQSYPGSSGDCGQHPALTGDDSRTGPALRWVVSGLHTDEVHTGRCGDQSDIRPKRLWQRMT